MKHFTRWWQLLTRWLPVFLAVVTVLIHAVTLPDQALTDDDDFYAPAGIRAADWLQDALTAPSTAWRREGIDSAFGINHEHPPVAKYVFGLSERFWHRLLPVFGVLDGARMGTVFFVALMVLALTWWVQRGAGSFAALGTWLVLLTMPRFYLHSEVATLDVPVAAMIALVTVAFDVAGHRRRAGLAVGVLFGLAAATKLNAPFAVLPLLALWLLTHWRGFIVVDERSSPEMGTAGTATTSTSTSTLATERPTVSLQLPPIPLSLWSMALLGPLVFVMVWPWLWPDPIGRLGGYLAFHLRHYPIYLFYDGEIWEKPFAPGTASVVLGLGSLPLFSIFLAAIGSVGAVVAIRRLARSATSDGALATTGDRLAALAFLQALVSTAVVAVNDVPRYGGEKLFMPAFPFIAVLAGLGLARLRQAWLRVRDRLRPADVVTPPAQVRVRLGLSAMLLVLASAPGLVGLSKTSGGFGLSYYGELVGGLRGATARGYERTYYDLADKTLARWLDNNAQGRSVHIEPNHKEYVRTYRWLQKDGVISRDGVDLTTRLDRAGLVVLMHERRWRTYPALLRQLRGLSVVAEHRIDGVPIWTVYQRRAGNG